MKYSSVFALTLCGALAFALVGCKYDDPENAGLANPNDVVTAPVDDGLNAGSGADVATDPNAMNAAAVDPNAIDPNADTASLAQATDIPIDQDPNYERCTDVDFAPVYFGFDASALAPSEMAKIEAVALHLAQNPDRAVIVEGELRRGEACRFRYRRGSLVEEPPRRVRRVQEEAVIAAADVQR